MATNLVPGYSGDDDQVYVRDLVRNETQMVSVRSDGTPGNDYAEAPSISADGGLVAFHSESTNLLDTISLAGWNAYVHNRSDGKTRRLVSPTIEVLTFTSRYPVISGTGKYVAFESPTDGLVTGDTNGKRDIFIQDLATMTRIRVSTSAAGTQGNENSDRPSISSDGSHVAFESFATNLVGSDTNGKRDVFVWSRR